MLAVALMFGGIFAFLVNLGVGGVLFALGLGLLSLLAAVRRWADNRLLSLVFLGFGLFLFWLILIPYLAP